MVGYIMGLLIGSHLPMSIFVQCTEVLAGTATDGDLVGLGWDLSQELPLVPLQHFPHFSSGKKTDQDDGMCG